MGLETVHPDYADMEPEWEKMRDVFRGERHVKSRGTRYLKPTKAMILDGFYSTTALATGVVVSIGGDGVDPDLQGAVVSGPYSPYNSHNVGVETYNAYRDRAIFPDYVSEAVEKFLGLLHANDAVFELPDAMKPMLENATSHGETMLTLLRRINTEQLVTTRLGLLLDMPENPDQAQPLPYIALYVAEAVRNWDDGEEGTRANLAMVVLDESGVRREPGTFVWEPYTKRRVLELIGGTYFQGVFTEDGAGAAPDYVLSDMKPPMLRGQPLRQIPFEFVNGADAVSCPDQPILLGLANLCLAIYRGEADYRLNLFMQGQDTLVVKGDLKRTAGPNDLPVADEGPLRTGAGAMIQLEGGAENDAKYIGVGSTGLSEQRTALENLEKRADAKAGALSTSTTADQASGEALRTRVAARTASLTQIAKTGAAALEKLLKAAAVWLGQNPDQVKVTPNLEFADWQMTGADLLALVQAQDNGAPISDETIHALAVAGGLSEFDYATEMEKIQADKARKQAEAQANAKAMASALAATGGSNTPPNDPNNPGQPNPGTTGGGANPGA